MNSNYFSILEEGLSAQLDELSLDEVVVHLQNHLASFLLEPVTASTYVNRLGMDPALAESPPALSFFRYLVGKIGQMQPLSLNVLAVCAKVLDDPAIPARLDVLNSLDHDRAAYERLAELNPVRDATAMRNGLLELLTRHPDYVRAAQLLLDLEHANGTRATWVKRFSCPAPLLGIWGKLLFHHHARLGHWEPAMEHMARALEHGRDETTLNLAAECLVREGRTQEAMGLYEESLSLDRCQGPVHFRLAQLGKPFSKDPSLLGTRSTCICLYTWNKADLLGETLESLARSNTGDSPIRVLLNGCTDHSREVADRCGELFPGNDYRVLSMPVNIGAPAARNYLLSLEEVQGSEYVAFLDDDVLVQEDWLEWFLSVAEADRRVGVVGCKVVHDGPPFQLQYLYRHVGIASHGMLKMSLQAPERRYDNHLYDVVRETRNVMGCLHLLRVEALADAPQFDIRFSPSQLDDIDHDLQLCLKGWKILYCGLVRCVHRQSSGLKGGGRGRVGEQNLGNVIGNDVKFHYKHLRRMDEMARLDSVSLPDTAAFSMFD